MGKISDYMLQIAADDRHGYDQRHRDGEPDYDCSSLVCAAVRAAAIKHSGTYTGDMYNALIKAGFKDVTKSVNLKTGAGLQIDDVLLTPNKHTAVYTGNGKITHARIAENGTAYADKAGDQTGKEICTTSYDGSYPWKYVLRYDPDKLLDPVEYLKLAIDVLNGYYGTGEDRKKKLGQYYSRVQRIVNIACGKD